jgi:hypothetical protein
MHQPATQRQFSSDTRTFVGKKPNDAYSLFLRKIQTEAYFHPALTDLSWIMSSTGGAFLSILDA